MVFWGLFVTSGDETCIVSILRRSSVEFLYVFSVLYLLVVPPPPSLRLFPPPPISSYPGDTLPPIAGLWFNLNPAKNIFFHRWKKRFAKHKFFRICKPISVVNLLLFDDLFSNWIFHFLVFGRHVFYLEPCTIRKRWGVIIWAWILLWLSGENSDTMGNPAISHRPFVLSPHPNLKVFMLPPAPGWLRGGRLSRPIID